MAKVIKQVGGVCRSKIGTPITGSQVVVQIFGKVAGTPDKYELFLGKTLSSSVDGTWAMTIFVEETDTQVLGLFHHEGSFEAENNLAGAEFLPLATTTQLRHELLPSADSATVNWTPSTGSDHYALVNADDDSTYLSTSGTGPDIMDIPDLAISGSVFRIKLFARVMFADETDSLQIGLRKAGDVVYTDALGTLTLACPAGKANQIMDIETDWVVVTSFGSTFFNSLQLRILPTPPASAAVTVYKCGAIVESDSSVASTSTTTSLP